MVNAPWRTSWTVEHRAIWKQIKSSLFCLLLWSVFSKGSSEIKFQLKKKLPGVKTTWKRKNYLEWDQVPAAKRKNYLEKKLRCVLRRLNLHLFYSSLVLHSFPLVDLFQIRDTNSQLSAYHSYQTNNAQEIFVQWINEWHDMR